MKVLVTFAVEAEFAPWRTRRSFKSVRVRKEHWSGGVDVYEAQIGQCAVWVFLTGIGIKCFDFATASCFKDAGVDLVLSSGLAGSLKQEIEPEDVVASRKVGTLRDASGVPMTPEIVDLAERRGATLIALLLTSDHIVETQEEKNRLANFGEAVDMESFHVAQQFSDHKIPVAVVRAISDGNDQDLPVNFEKCLTPQGQVKTAPLLRELLARPKRVPELIRFGLQSRNASRKLANFLDGLIEALTPDILSRRDTEVSAI
jgi:adenosylhomocysteine nucleosidase